MGVRVFRSTYNYMICFAALSMWVYNSYFKLDVASLLVFFGNDAHCDISTEAVGVHCFGDYGSTRISHLTDLPQGPEAVYPVVTRLFRYPFQLIDDLVGYRYSALIFTLMLGGCVLYPLVDQARKKAIRLHEAALIGLTSLPFVATLDRGNLIGFATPAIYYFVRHSDAQNRAGQYVSFGICVAIKPQLAILSLITLFTISMRRTVELIVLTFSVLLGPYLLFGTRAGDGITTWIRAMLEWGKTNSPGISYPSNLSITTLFASDIASKTSGTALAFLVFGSLSYLLCKARLMDTGKPNDKTALGGLLLATIIVSSPISYPYYTVFMLPLLALLLDRDRHKHEHPTIAGHSFVQISLAVMMAPVIIPSSLTVGSQTGPSGVYNLYPAIQVCALLVCIAIFLRHLASNNHGW